ncbi:hypothetical protein Fuma_06020 [Fuerstiella marisgermanici]|uniref:Uncharacterized protein n=1 Tax=Fuerstiella marisgermanici TaxID=1891926 RepID=A0A1P8WQM8_9PLAN|nr:hypothetical protein Fuma_06020 [Fuerstiella marisgermanici]
MWTSALGTATESAVPHCATFGYPERHGPIVRLPAISIRRLRQIGANVLSIELVVRMPHQFSAGRSINTSNTRRPFTERFPAFSYFRATISKMLLPPLPISRSLIDRTSAQWDSSWVQNPGCVEMPNFCCVIRATSFLSNTHSKTPTEQRAVIRVAPCRPVIFLLRVE